MPNSFKLFNKIDYLSLNMQILRHLKEFIGVLIFIVISSSQCIATHSERELAQDLDYMTQILEEVHPNLYSVYSKAEFYREKLKLLSQKKAVHNSLEAWKVVMPLLHRLEDGHTFAFRPDRELLSQISSPANRLFPVTVTISETRRLLVAKDYQQFLRKGDEIVSINRVQASDIIERLQVFVPGEKPRFWNAQLSEDFGTYLWISQGSSDLFDLVVHRRNSDFKTRIPGLPLTELKRTWLTSTASSKSEPYSFSILDKSIGFLNLRQFSDSEKFKVFITDINSQLKEKKINHLIIDIRGNGGGNSAIGNILMSYIAQKPFRQYAEVDIKVSELIKSYYGCDKKKQSTYLTCWKPRKS